MEIAKTTNQEEAQAIKQKAFEELEAKVIASFEGDDVLIQGTTVFEFVAEAA